MFIIFIFIKVKISCIEIGTVTLKDVTDKESDIVLSCTDSSLEEGEKLGIEVSRECISIPNLYHYSVEKAQSTLETRGIKSNIDYLYPNIDDVRCNGVYDSIYVISQDKDNMVDKINPAVNLKVQTPAIQIDNFDSKVNSAGGVSISLAFTNISGKQIAYVTFTAKLYDTMGYPAYCEVRNESTVKLKYTGPLNGWSSSGWYVWQNVIYNSAFGAF